MKASSPGKGVRKAFQHQLSNYEEWLKLVRAQSLTADKMVAEKQSSKVERKTINI